jgi:hypothetical protein
MIWALRGGACQSVPEREERREVAGVVVGGVKCAATGWSAGSARCRLPSLGVERPLHLQRPPTRSPSAAHPRRSRSPPPPTLPAPMPRVPVGPHARPAGCTAPPPFLTGGMGSGCMMAGCARSRPSPNLMSCTIESSQKSAGAASSHAASSSSETHLQARAQRHRSARRAAGAAGGRGRT